jgi:hypothetical protein
MENKKNSKPKRFEKLTAAEIQAMSDEDFKDVSPFEKRSCYDCAHLTSALSWWCGNDEAIKFRGTRIPGGIKCLYWEPDWSMIDTKYKTIENGYLSTNDHLKLMINYYWLKIKGLFSTKGSKQ